MVQLSLQFWGSINSSQLQPFEFAELDAFVLDLADGDLRLEATQNNSDEFGAMKNLPTAAARKILEFEGLASHLSMVIRD